MSHTAPVVATNPANFTKLIAYLAFTALGALRIAIGPDDAVTLTALLQVAVAVGGAIAVYRGASTQTKLVAAGLTAAVQALIPLATNFGDFASISIYDYIGVVFAGLAAAGVILPNYAKPTAPATV